MQWVFDIFSSLVNFVISIVTGFFDVIKMLPAIISTLTTSIGFLPDFLIVFATITLVISIAYLLAGRGGASN